MRCLRPPDPAAGQHPRNGSPYRPSPTPPYVPSVHDLRGLVTSKDLGAPESVCRPFVNQGRDRYPFAPAHQRRKRRPGCVVRGGSRTPMPLRAPDPEVRRVCRSATLAGADAPGGSIGPGTPDVTLARARLDRLDPQPCRPRRRLRRVLPQRPQVGGGSPEPRAGLRCPAPRPARRWRTGSSRTRATCRSGKAYWDRASRGCAYKGSIRTDTPADSRPVVSRG